MVGDIGTALAILRPDYWSGPGMSQPLGNLHDVVDCASRDRGPRCLGPPPLRQVGFDVDRSAIRTPWLSRLCSAEKPAILISCCTKCGGKFDDSGVRAFRVGLISEAKAAHVEECAKFLGVDFCESGLLDDDKAASVYRHSELGHSVAFVAIVCIFRSGSASTRGYFRQRYRRIGGTRGCLLARCSVVETRSILGHHARLPTPQSDT